MGNKCGTKYLHLFVILTPIFQGVLMGAGASQDPQTQQPGSSLSQMGPHRQGASFSPEDAQMLKSRTGDKTQTALNVKSVQDYRRTRSDHKKLKRAIWWLPGVPISLVKNDDADNVKKGTSSQKTPKVAQEESQHPAAGKVKTVRCAGDQLASSIALRQGKGWARKMADSWGHVRAGTVDQEVDLVGVKEQCLSVQVPPSLNFHTQYCVATFGLNKVLFPKEIRHAQAVTGLSMGTCLPSTCDHQDVKVIIFSQVAQRHLVPDPGVVDQVFCFQADGTTSLSAAAAGMLTFLCLWTLLLLLSTAVHGWARRPEPSCQQSQGDSSSQCQRQRLRAAPRRVHYQHHSQNSQRLGADASDPSETDSSMVKIEFNVDQDNTPLLDPSRPAADQSIPRRTLSERNRRVRGILRNKQRNASLLRYTSATRAEESSNLRRLIGCLSLELHVRKLFDTSKSDSELGCLHGVRVLSLVWVVVADSVLQQVVFIRNTFPLLAEWRHHKLLYSLIGNGSLGFESLFTVSGLSVGYVYSFHLDRQMGKMNWGTYLLTRYGKIVPAMVMVGVVYLAMFPDLVTGPMSVGKAPDQDSCLHRGWMNVLLVHNFASDMCMSWTWFLAVDFQLFLLTPFLLLTLYHRPRLAYLLVVVVVLASWIANGIITRIRHVPIAQTVIPDLGNISNSAPSDESFAAEYFYKPWTHAGSFFPPLLLGYLLHRSKRRASFRARTLVVGWLLVFAASMAVLFGVSSELVGERLFSENAVAFYNAVHGTVWSLCVCWLVLVCSTGYGGPVDSFLSWSGWKPCSRLALGGFLVYPIVLMAYNACLQQLMYVTSVVMLYHVLAVLLFCFLLSAVLCLTVEMPVNALLSSRCCCCVTSVR
ncbi:O-acyltransferase like protein-like [Babylonia areolata]|uniref:O-acyltransferase like protein-like n=1 Tax=Babylonia areolata TaxID=304850 RepID=UPI003FCFC305